MAVADLERCPVCAADLGMSPPRGRCRDCGFEYDEHTRVWRSSESWGRLAGVYCTIGLVAGLLAAVAEIIRGARVPQPAFPLVLALAAPALGLLYRRVLSGRITGRFVALTPAGIVVGTRARPRLVTWDDFNRLTEQRGVPKIERRNAPALVPLDDIFDTPAHYANFRDALRLAAKRHAPAAGLGGEPLHSQPGTE